MADHRLQWFPPGKPGEALRIVGAIDEEAVSVLDQIVALPAAQALDIDVSGVRRINSLGVRHWIFFLRKLDGRSVILRRVPPVMVEQLNSVLGFGGTATLVSVLAPYLCDTCQESQIEELLLGTDVTPASVASGDVPTRKCTHCGQTASFDDLPDRYLGFVNYVNAKSSPARNSGTTR